MRLSRRLKSKKQDMPMSLAELQYIQQTRELTVENGDPDGVSILPGDILAKVRASVFHAHFFLEQNAFNKP